MAGASNATSGATSNASSSFGGAAAAAAAAAAASYSKVSTATVTAVGSVLVSGTPSTHPHYPCGDVHSNVWHFKAPAKYLGDIRGNYNGRLQFSMMASSHTGTPRETRGAVEIIGGSGTDNMRISYPLQGFELPTSSGWTGYSVVLREDYGWVKEPENIPTSFKELYSVLANVTELRIRGDAWSYSRAGYGQEAMYINNVTLLKL